MIWWVWCFGLLDLCLGVLEWSGALLVVKYVFFKGFRVSFGAGFMIF